MMMNLDKIISNFISGTIELNDVIEKNDISYFSLVKLIKNYCYSNKIPIVKDISYRLNTPIREMLDLRSHGMSYRKLAEKYKCTSDAIRQGLIKYCEEKNIDFPEVNRGPKKKKIPMKEIYELKSQGLTYKEIAEEYNCDATTISLRLKEYCEQNNLDIPKANKGKREKNLPMEKICELKKQEMTYEEIGEKYDCTHEAIRQKLKEYCEQNNLEIPKANKGPRKKNLPMEKIYELRKQGTTYDELAEKYDYTKEGIRQRLIKYCKKNNLEFPEVDMRHKNKNLSMEEIYELKTQGMTYDELSEKYNCNYSTILNRLKSYCEQNNLKIPKAKSGPKQKTLSIEEIYKLKSQGMSYKKMAEKYNCTYVTIRRRLKEYEEELVLRNKYLEILLQDFTRIKDDILNKTIGSFYDDKENKKQDDYSFIKR